MTEMAIIRNPDDKRKPQKSGKLRFGQLAVDIVHSIFRLVLQLDRIHDYDVPFEVLGELRKQVFRLRCVSTPWNEFILSSPQYWCVINVRAPQPAMVKAIERAQTLPLCVYSSTDSGFWRAVYFDHIQPMLVARHGQIRTLRLDDMALYDFGLSLILSGLPNVKTLEFVATPYPHLEEPRLADDLPQLRHLISTSWSPSADAAWAQGLETLVLREVGGFGQVLYRILNLCAHRIRRLSLGLGDLKGGLPHIPATISLPHLEELRLDIIDRETAAEFVRRMRTPLSSSIAIGVRLDIEDLDVTRDLLDFVFPEEWNALNPGRATIEFNSYHRRLIAECVRGPRSLQFSVWGNFNQEEYETIRNVLQAVHLRLAQPVTSVTISCDGPSDIEVLKSLSSSNVQSISIIAYCLDDLADLVTGAIGRRMSDEFGQANVDERDWAFQSVRCLAIDCCDRDPVGIGEVVHIVTVRQEALRKNGRNILEELVLVHCSLEGTIFSDAAAKLGTVRISLREENGDAIVDFQLGISVL